MRLSEKKKYRTWTVPQTLEIVLAVLRGDRSVAESEGSIRSPRTCSYTWREKLLEGGP